MTGPPLRSDRPAGRSEPLPARKVVESTARHHGGRMGTEQKVTVLVVDDELIVR